MPMEAPLKPTTCVPRNPPPVLHGRLSNKHSFVERTALHGLLSDPWHAVMPSYYSRSSNRLAIPLLNHRQLASSWTLESTL